MKTERLIAIVSGEGIEGIPELYIGDPSLSSIKTRLKREGCNGERWARAVEYLYDNECGSVGIDLETGEYRPFPETIRNKL